MGSDKAFSLQRLFDEHKHDSDNYPIIIADPNLETQDSDVDMSEPKETDQQK